MGTGDPRLWRRSTSALVALTLLAGCGASEVPIERAGGAAPLQAEPASSPEVHLESPDVTEPPVPQAPPATEPPAPPPAETVPPTTAAPRPHEVAETGFSPFAVAEQLVLLHPSALVERVGFHEASHDGARHLDATETTVRPLVLESRERGTGPQTAADIVVPPDAEIRAPVTGTVVRAGSYTLYCEHTDDYVVIEPDDRPGWEVKVLHIQGVQVQAGQRVEAGATVLAPRPTALPFASQVDDHTGEPAWPHVHVEVVDPSIPDRPSPGGGGSSC